MNEDWILFTGALSILLFMLAGMAWLADWLERKYPHG